MDGLIGHPNPVAIPAIAAAPPVSFPPAPRRWPALVPCFDPQERKRDQTPMDCGNHLITQLIRRGVKPDPGRPFDMVLDLLTIDR